MLFSLFGTRGAASDSSASDYRSLDPAAYVLFLLAPALLVLVRRWPRAVLAVTTVLVAAYLARDYPGGPIYLVTVTASAALGWVQPLRRSLPPVAAAAVVLVAAAAVHLTGGSVLSSALNLLAWSLVPVVPWALTSLVRINRTSARQAAVELHRHQVDDERMQIARDVHDVVGHSLAVISMQAGVALHVGQRRPEQAQLALEAIARSSREALAELRGTLAMLRGDAAPLARASGIGDLSVLVAGFAATGQDVRLSVTGGRDGLPAAHELAVGALLDRERTSAPATIAWIGIGRHARTLCRARWHAARRPPSRGRLARARRAPVSVGQRVISVVVADDQPLIRMGLAVLIEAEDGLELLGQAADGREALDIIRRTRPDVAVVDIRMPALDGIAVLDQITADADLTSTRVIMLTTFGVDDYVFAALRAGASGFLLKDDDTSQLVHAIRTVASGESLLSPAVTTRVISSFASPEQTTGGPHPDIGQLTAREREIVAQVATGLSNDEIADHFVLSPATVRTHVGRAMLKLRARDRAQLVVFAYQSQLVGKAT